MKNIKLGKVIDAKISKERRLRGLIVKFETEKTINNHSVVQVKTSKGIKPFNVIEVEVSGKTLIGKALECGYWARKLGDDENFDLRTIIDCEIELVEDKKILSQINTESCWC